MTTYVFSRTLAPEDHPKVTIVRADVRGTVERLRRAPGKEIWLYGGGELFRSLLDLDQVDLIEVGPGPRAARPGNSVRAAAGSADRASPDRDRRLPTGILLLTYEVRRGPG